MTEHDKRLFGYNAAPGLNPEKTKKMSARKKIGVIALSAASLIAVHRPAANTARELAHKVSTPVSHRLDQQFPDTDKFEKVTESHNANAKPPVEVVDAPDSASTDETVTTAPGTVSFTVEEGDNAWDKANDIATNQKDVLPVENAILMESQKDGKPGLQVGEKITIPNPNPGVQVEKSPEEGQ